MTAATAPAATALAAIATTVDVRELAPRERHPLILSTFQRLARGQAMELVNDHDPKPLYYQFQAEMPGDFDWRYLEAGPDVWRVAITRTGNAGASRAVGGCCGGGCSGT
ncbi:MAG: DUF2249 domain-containing protein [Burkholderiaceae bacterium]|nr:DUF2249 domain-containing protein [Burkholderiaceae bacterium]